MNFGRVRKSCSDHSDTCYHTWFDAANAMHETETRNDMKWTTTAHFRRWTQTENEQNADPTSMCAISILSTRAFTHMHAHNALHYGSSLRSDELGPRRVKSRKSKFRSETQASQKLLVWFFLIELVETGNALLVSNRFAAHTLEMQTFFRTSKITPRLLYSTGQQMATRVREHIHNNVHMLSMHTVSASPSRGDKADGSAHSDDPLYGDDDTPVVAIRFTYW
jgi:hypothetical protein